MAMNPIPPQAYTKDSLLKAYAWLQNQDVSIKEMATTPDILVSLYLKATRDGDAALDRPSIQNFKHELKQLAGLMGEFEKDGLAEPKSKSHDVAVSNSSTAASSVVKKEPAAKSVESAGIDFHSLEKKYNAQTHAAIVSSTELDSNSVALINEVRQKLNLSSNHEALKMLLQVGYNKLKKLL